MSEVNIEMNSDSFRLLPEWLTRSDLVKRRAGCGVIRVQNDSVATPVKI